MTFNQKLILIGIIGFTFGGWYTLASGGAHIYNLLTLCIGLEVSLLFFLIAASIDTSEPHRRFKNCRRIEL